MREPLCANCNHPPHEDPINGDFCWKVTTAGLCGCTDWLEAEDVYDDEDERDVFERMNDDEIEDQERLHA